MTIFKTIKHLKNMKPDILAALHLPLSPIKIRINNETVEILQHTCYWQDNLVFMYLPNNNIRVILLPHLNICIISNMGRCSMKEFLDNRKSQLRLPNKLIIPSTCEADSNNKLRRFSSHQDNRESQKRKLPLDAYIILHKYTNITNFSILSMCHQVHRVNRSSMTIQKWGMVL